MNGQHSMDSSEPGYPSDRRHKVRIRPVAFEDIERIRLFIAKDHPANALEYVERIAEAIEALRFMPQAWPRVPTRRMPDLRQRLIGSHRILFQVVDDSAIVVVSRVVHAQRSLPSIVRTLRQEP
jgi:plasmid stabilization system protein ParE